MRQIFPGLIVGILFGVGLALSGLIDPARVLGFLDLAGSWDPTLAFVMISALIPSGIAYMLVKRMKQPLLGGEFCIPEIRAIERQLVVGGLIFGVGWGLVGLCPGPAIASLVLGRWQVWLFVGAMIVGMGLHRAYADPSGGRLTRSGRMSAT